MRVRYLTAPAALALLQKATTGKGALIRFADTHDLHHQYVTAVLKGERPIGPKMAKALGLEKQVLYVRVS